MAKPPKTLIFIFLVIRVAAAIPLLTKDPEPRYDGTPLIVWVKKLALAPSAAAIANLPSDNLPLALIFMKNQDEQYILPEHAIRQIGTNAIPYLMRWIDYEVPRWHYVILGLLSRIPLINDLYSLQRVSP